MNKKLANLQAAHSCDVDLPCPHPEYVPHVCLAPRCSTSQVDITMLMVELQGTAVDDDEGAGGKDDEAGKVVGNRCPNANSDDDEMNEMPSKKARTVTVGQGIS